MPKADLAAELGAGQAIHIVTTSLTGKPHQ